MSKGTPFYVKTAPILMYAHVLFMLQLLFFYVKTCTHLMPNPQHFRCPLRKFDVQHTCTIALRSQMQRTSNPREIHPLHSRRRWRQRCQRHPPAVINHVFQDASLCNFARNQKKSDHKADGLHHTARIRWLNTRARGATQKATRLNLRPARTLTIGRGQLSIRVQASKTN